MVPDQSVPHTICSGVNLCDSEKPYRDKVQNENTSGDFIFPLDFASNSSNSICKGKKTEAFSHKETMEGIDRGILKHGQAKDQGSLVDANLRCPDSGIYDYWEELPCGIYSVSMHNPSSLKVEHFYECGIGGPRLPSLSVGLTGTVKKYEWQDELLLKLIQWDRRLVEPNKVNLLTSSRADCNINQTCKFGEANELVGIHDAHILTGTSKARNDASALLGKSLERDSLKSLDPYQTVKNILQNEKEFQLKVSLRDNREAARHFQSKDEQANDAQHSKPGFEHESFSDISIQGEGKTEYYAVQRLQEALKEAVKRRTSNIRRLCQDIVSISKLDGLKSSTFKDWNVPPVAILFSGGLDSMVLAVLADQCLQPDCAIELLNVSFEGLLAPDRRTAIAGIAELQELSPQRRWILVEVDADLHQQELQSSHLLSLICPSKTYMDFNIGTALWFAARGDGWVDSTLHPDWLDMIRSASFPLENQRLDMDLHETKDNLHPSCPSHGGELKRFNYKSEARVLLVGTGADEQCAGYARYRTKFKLGGWVALQEEMKLDMQRIWKRNMGRDDRCIADNGKEVCRQKYCIFITLYVQEC
ncbi:hypothetical protein O6H91_20G016900 [Diphasiastrum complanatum]|uniref:Uncharacterized protein n=1 Tax=Diphasiastrum complanatum TaxID=34168 RepID=A0ACC2ANJ5_DIPCM|nr:hypothetical protein O6H91_20G016900 [Diphasiastrum complanatum]